MRAVRNTYTMSFDGTNVFTGNCKSVRPWSMIPLIDSQCSLRCNILCNTSFSLIGRGVGGDYHPCHPLVSAPGVVAMYRYIMG